jgi:L-amino acid N-acyltransferase YncA
MNAMTNHELLLPAGHADPESTPARAGQRPAPVVSIRPAIGEDVAAITRIYNDSLPTAAPVEPEAEARAGGRRLAASRLVPFSAGTLLPWMESHRQHGRPLWVAQVNGEIVGWLSLLGFSDRPACGCAAEVAVYVAGGRCGQGIGRALLRHALREAPRWHIDRLMAYIWHDNTASRGLFRSEGFGAWGSLPGVVWAEGRSLDMLILGLDLTAAT